MDFRLLGQLEVIRDGEGVDLGPFRQRSLLALLLIHRGRVLSTDRIMDSLWGEAAASTKQNALWVYVSNLRSALEPERHKPSEGSFLRTRAPGYVLEVGESRVDVEDFEQLVAEGRQLAEADPAAASVALGEALGLWRGRALEEFTYEQFAEDEIRRLEDVRIRAVECRIDADLTRGLSNDLVSELEGLVRTHPLREHLAGQLITALHGSGRPAEAERVYQELSARLGEELGVEPSSAVRMLHTTLATEQDRLPRVSISGARTETARLAVRGYELRQLLAETSVGAVHAAFQPAVGREVTVTRVRADCADDPGFIGRFENDAKGVAAIEHPHVVPLFDFWREPGGAFLVAPLLQGGTLADLLRDGPLVGDAAGRFVDQVGGALRAAHRLGIGHGNVLAEHVYLDAEGNYFLGDFRIGLPPGGDGEQEIESDDRAFASLVDGATRGRLPAAVATAAQAVRNPYKGLRAFDRTDAADFFGRERLVERLVSRLGRSGSAGRFTVLVGPSGSGKSSAVRAGLLPAVRAGSLAGSQDWFITEMTPGAHPFENLVDALEAVAGHSWSSPFDQLSHGTTGFADAIDALLPSDTRRLLLVIDQLEELYLQVDADTRARFIDGLVAAVQVEGGRLLVVATMRGDFYDRPLEHAGLGELFRHGTEVITPMTADELARAVVEPAAGAGVDVEPGVVASVVADVANQPAALPLLQFALTELFEHRVDGSITLDAYVKLGGVGAALARRADGLFDLLGDEAQEVARQVLLRLVTVGQNTGEDTRRRVLVSDLSALGSSRHVRAVLESFGRHRLLTFDRDPVSRGPTVEIAHEALLREWGRLRELVDENRVGMRMLHALSSAAGEWVEAGQDPSLLYRGTRLDVTDDWVQSSRSRLNQTEREFMSASTQTRQDELEIERDRVRQGDRQNRRLRRLLVAVATAAVVAVVLGFLALQQRQQADDARFVGETRRIAADAPQLVQTNRRLGLLLAAEAYRREPSPITLGSLQRVLLATDGLLGYLGSGQEYRSALWSADGSQIIGVRPDAVDLFDAESFEQVEEFPVIDAGPAVAGPAGVFAVVSANRRLEVFDSQSGSRLQTIPHDEQILAVEFSPDGASLATGDARGFLRLFDVASGAERWSVHAHPEQPTDDIVMPDGVALSGAHEPASIPVGVRDIDFTDDGLTIGTAGGFFIRTWSTADGSARHDVFIDRPSFTDNDRRTAGRPAQIDFRGDGDVIAARVNRYLQVVDLDTQNVVEFVVVLSNSASAVSDAGNVTAAFGTHAIVMELDQVAVIDLANGERIQPSFDLQSSATVANVGLSPDQATLVSAGGDGIVVWALDGQELITASVPHQIEAGGVEVRSQGLLLAISDGNSSQAGRAVWDLSAEPPTRVELPGPDGRVFLDVPDSLILQDPDAELTLRDLADPGTIMASYGTLNSYTQALSPDGRRLVFGAGQPDPAWIHVHEVRSGTAVRTPIEFFDGAVNVTSLSFNVDGSRLAAASLDGRAQVFDTGTWEPIGPALGSGAGQVLAVEYSHDGRFLATSDATGTIILRDPITGQPLGSPLVGTTGGIRFAGGQPLAFTPDGRFLISTIDGVGRLWDIESRTQVGTPFTTRAGSNMIPSSVGRSLPALGQGSVLIYDLDVDGWFDIACRAAGRNLTVQEWGRFGPEDTSPQQTCAQWDFAHDQQRDSGTNE